MLCPRSSPKIGLMGVTRRRLPKRTQPIGGQKLRFRCCVRSHRRTGDGTIGRATTLRPVVSAGRLLRANPTNRLGLRSDFITRWHSASRAVQRSSLPRETIQIALQELVNDTNEIVHSEVGV